MTVEQDEDGWWCAHAQLGPDVGANGQGQTKKQALDDLREAVLASFEALPVLPGSRVVRASEKAGSESPRR
jgi:predicted RNase H-like HicB family nuclease